MERIYTDRSQKSWSKIVRCTGNVNDCTTPCGHLWKISEYDLVAQKQWEMFDIECVAFGIICPDCGTFTEIPSSAIPAVISNRCYARSRNKRIRGRRRLFNRKRYE